jgi:molybdopterin molybdotransferase
VTGRLMRVEDAQARILGLARRQAGAGPELVGIDAALGRVLAEDVAAAVTLPPWDNSAMDGYAIRSADVAGAGKAAAVELRVVGDAAAGGTPRQEAIRPGEAVRIATGAPVPPGADAIAQVEVTSQPSDAAASSGTHGRSAPRGTVPERVLVHAAVAPGTHIRRTGTDLRAGDALLERGTALGPAQLALLAGAGVPSVRVHSRTIVAVLATGNEVRAPGEPLGEAGIPDANGPGLRALVAAAGAVVIDLGIARDELAEVMDRLTRGLDAGADAVVVAGGVSVGPYDVVKTAFEALGSVELWRVAVQPGKPFALATVYRAGTEARSADRAASAGTAGRPVLLFGLPGNPVSAFVTFELFARPAIRAIAGRRDPMRPIDRGVLLDEARTSPGRRAYLRVTAERGPDGAVARDDRGRARVHLAKGPAGQGSHVLSALAAADALAIVPEEVEIHPAGDPVELLWLDAP